MAKFVAMGEYYYEQPYGLVKVVCRAYDHESGEPLIIYANVDDGGCSSELFSMSEWHFENIFLKHLCGSSVTG